jgi:Glycosyl hydrolase catalytic core
MARIAFALFLFLKLVAAVNVPKRGLVDVFAPHQTTDNPLLSSSPHLSWVYNYGAQPSSPYPYCNLSFVPMIHGTDNSANFLSTITKGQKYEYILTFNEPDQPLSVGGSALSVAEAVSIWNAQVQPLASKGYKLGAPGGPFLVKRG